MGLFRPFLRAVRFLPEKHQAQKLLATGVGCVPSRVAFQKTHVQNMPRRLPLRTRKGFACVHDAQKQKTSIGETRPNPQAQRCRFLLQYPDKDCAHRWGRDTARLAKLQGNNSQYQPPKMVVSVLSLSLASTE